MRFGISSYNWSRAHIAGAQANLEPRRIESTHVRRASRLVQFQSFPLSLLVVELHHPHTISITPPPLPDDQWVMLVLLE